jgi:hypothetical protein
MDRNRKNVAAIFRNWNRYEFSDQNIAHQYAEFLINKLRSGHLPNGIHLPPRGYICQNNNITKYALDRALKEMKEYGYLLMKSGQRPTTQYPPKGGIWPVEKVEVEVEVFADYHIIPSRLQTINPLHIYQAYKNFYWHNPAPLYEDSVSASLREFTAVKYNEIYASGFQKDNFYYSHSLLFMLQVVLRSVYQPGALIVIPAKTYTKLPELLKGLRYKYLEIDMDNEGFNVDALADLCKHHKIAAVFLMSRASFPTTVSTSKMRTKDLFRLRKKNDFKIVEIDFFLPWLKRKANPLLKLAGASREHVVYIYPHSYLLWEISDVVIVSTQGELQQIIKKNLKDTGSHSSRAIAESMCFVMMHREFLIAEQKIATLVQKYKIFIKKVFMESRFWDMEGLLNDSGLAIFLRPQHNSFPTDSYSLLKAQGILAMNPNCYGGTAEDGLRFDFSYYIGHYDFEKKIRLVEHVCRSTVW